MISQTEQLALNASRGAALRKVYLKSPRCPYCNVLMYKKLYQQLGHCGKWRCNLLATGDYEDRFLKAKRRKLDSAREQVCIEETGF